MLTTWLVCWSTLTTERNFNLYHMQQRRQQGAGGGAGGAHVRRAPCRRPLSLTPWHNASFFLRHQIRFCTPARCRDLRARLTTRLRSKHARVLTPYEALLMLDDVRDPTNLQRQKVGELAATFHAVQYVQHHAPADRDVHLVASLHSLGKIMSLGTAAWTPVDVFGSTRPVDVQLDPRDISYEFVSETTSGRKKYQSPALHCGFDRLVLTTNHSVELAHMIRHALTQRAWRMLRLHTCSAWFHNHAYKEWENEDDERLRAYDAGFQVLQQALAKAPHTTFPNNGRRPSNHEMAHYIADVIQSIVPPRHQQLRIPWHA